MPTGFAFVHRLEVRFRDCDPMGHVNHAVYLTYLEQCRFAFWRHLTGALAGPGARIIIARAECDYRAPAFVGQELEVRVNVADIGRSSFTLVYEIVNVATGQRLADARTVLVGYDYEGGKSMPLSPEIRTLLERSRVQ
jgi:acyl-CoA thioester hydrolase